MCFNEVVSRDVNVSDCDAIPVSLVATVTFSLSRVWSNLDPEVDFKFWLTLVRIACCSLMPCLLLISSRYEVGTCLLRRVDWVRGSGLYKGFEFSSLERWSCAAGFGSAGFAKMIGVGRWSIINSSRLLELRFFSKKWI